MSPTPNPTFPLLTFTCACLAILLAGTSWDVRCLGRRYQGCATTPQYMTIDARCGLTRARGAAVGDASRGSLVRAPRLTRGPRRRTAPGGGPRLPPSTPYAATTARRAVATAAAHAPAPNTIATPSESMNGGSPLADGSRHARRAASP